MKLLHETLMKSAEAHGQRTALMYKEETLSYKQLEELSNQLSSICSANGVGPGDRVGMYIDKSIDSIVAIFAILKTGACYVPLDPLAPIERQKLILNDCALKHLITSSTKLLHVSKIAEHTKDLEYVFTLDIPREKNKVNLPGIKMYFKDDIASEPNTGLTSPQMTPEGLAYILYTSGSTGQPKGVMLSHMAAFNFVDWACRTFSLTSDDVVSSHAPLHFDLSILDIFASIMAGASICLVPQGLSSFPRSIVDFIEKYKITTWYSVPSILTQLIMHGNLEERSFPSLRQILFAGEAFPSKYLSKLIELIPDARYYNLYGPTETNVITYFRVKEAPALDTTIPIGVLCDNVRSFILDNSGNPVKKGETGELHVSCPTLMDGYWNDSQKTEGVLIENPFKTSSKEMLYKTGDLVHCNVKDELEYHGRCDHMIKSRGYRIEIGEIETALSAHTGLKEVAITAVADDTIGSKIKAVIVPKTMGEISENDIKLFCSKKLPHYMIPEIISILDALPRTSTGKIDRKKLSETDL